MEGAASRRGPVLKLIVIGAWGVSLLLAFGYRATSAPSHEPFHLSEPVLVREVGHDRVAVALVSIRCAICIERVDQIVEALTSLDADSHIVAASLGEPGEVLVTLGYPASLVHAFSMDELDQLRVGVVPAFLIMEGDLVEPVWVGLPNALQVWWRRAGD